MLYFVLAVASLSHPLLLLLLPFLSSRAGLPVSNDDTDSNKSGSSHSDLHAGLSHPGMLVFPAPSLAFQKGKQLPRGIYLNTHELVDISNDSESAQLRRLDRCVQTHHVGLSATT